MTQGERLVRKWHRTTNASSLALGNLIDAALAAAVQAERERVLDEVETYPDDWQPGAVVKAIRQRGTV